MRWIAVAAMLGLAGCGGPYLPPPAAPLPQETRAQPGSDAEARAMGEAAARQFVTVVERVQPVAEALCRARAAPEVNCDLRVTVDPRPGQPPNAFQTVDREGRPVVGFTLSLIADARNADEIAFVLGHEAGHNIAGHLMRGRATALRGAILAGVMAQASGGGPDAVRAAQEFGANVGARAYSKDFELEADAIGTEIAWRAGFDPVRGAAFFDRLPDPGDRFLGTHPPNARRKAVVAQTLALLQGRG